MAMVSLYTTSGCQSCRKARDWLVENNIKFQEKEVTLLPPTVKELKQLFSLAEDVTDIISVRSVAIQKIPRTLGCQLEDLSFNQLLDYIQKNPTGLRRPILTDGKRLMVGWDQDEITMFLPRKARKQHIGSPFVNLSN